MRRLITRDIVRDAEFPTIVKTRIIARQQQVVRVDREEVRAPTAEQVASVTENIRQQLHEVDGIIFEDYGKGFLSTDLVQQVSDLASTAGKVVTVDPNPRHPLTWRNVTAVKPNRSEAFHAAGIEWSDPVDPANDDEALLKVGRILLEKWDTKLLLITLGEQGMMLFEGGEPGTFRRRRGRSSMFRARATPRSLCSRSPCAVELRLGKLRILPITPAPWS